MTKDEWIKRAAAKLQPRTAYAQEHAEGLYQTYVVEGGEEFWGDDPEGAVEEDMCYWSA